MPKDKYGIEEYLKEFEQILSEKAPQQEHKPPPNLIQMIRGKKEKEWPLT